MTIGEQLAAPFRPEDVQFKPGAVSGNRALALAFVDARTVQDRLDAVLGIDGWQDDYQCLPDGGVICRLKIKIDGEWITKVDVGGQAEKMDGGDRIKSSFSDALKRVAVKFGVGRYLYSLPGQWVEYDPKYKKIVKPPQLPAWALPKVEQKQESKQPQLSAVKQDELLALLKACGKTKEGLLGWLGMAAGSELRDISQKQYEEAVKKLKNGQAPQNGALSEVTKSFQLCMKALHDAPSQDKMIEFRTIYLNGGPGREYSPRQIADLENLYKSIMETKFGVKVDSKTLKTEVGQETK